MCSLRATGQQVGQSLRALPYSSAPQTRQVRRGGLLPAGRRLALRFPRVCALVMFVRLNGVVRLILPGLLRAIAWATCSASGATAAA